MSHPTRMGPNPAPTQILSARPKPSKALSSRPKRSEASEVESLLFPARTADVGCPISRALFAREVGIVGRAISNIAQLRRLPQRLHRIPRRHKFMRHKPAEPRIGDSSHHPVP